MSWNDVFFVKPLTQANTKLNSFVYYIGHQFRGEREQKNKRGEHEDIKLRRVCQFCCGDGFKMMKKLHFICTAIEKN